MAIKAMSVEEVKRFRREWTQTIAITQYLMEIMGIRTIPIITNGSENRK